MLLDGGVQTLIWERKLGIIASVETWIYSNSEMKYISQIQNILEHIQHLINIETK